MSLQIRPKDTTYVGDTVSRGQYIELDNLRIWWAASGNFAPQISTVSGNGALWGCRRVFFYNGYINEGNMNGLSFNQSPTYLWPEQFGTAGDSQEYFFYYNGSFWRIMAIAAYGYDGTLLSLENMSANKIPGTMGPEKTFGIVANGVDVVVDNLKFRVGSTNMLQVSHASSPVRLIGQAYVGYDGGYQTNQIDLTTTTTPVYMGNPGWALSGSNQIGSVMIMEFFDHTNNVRYRVTQLLFSSNGNVTLNQHYITVERYT